MNINREETGQVQISFTYLRHMGPMYVHGSVKLQFDSLRAYSFKSSVTWPENENYEKYVKEGVEKALLELRGSLEKTEVQLLEINIDQVASSAMGFQSAAYIATYTAFFDLNQ